MWQRKTDFVKEGLYIDYGLDLQAEERVNWIADI